MSEVHEGEDPLRSLPGLRLDIRHHIRSKFPPSEAFQPWLIEAIENEATKLDIAHDALWKAIKDGKLSKRELNRLLNEDEKHHERSFDELFRLLLQLKDNKVHPPKIVGGWPTQVYEISGSTDWRTDPIKNGMGRVISPPMVLDRSGRIKVINGQKLQAPLSFKEAIGFRFIDGSTGKTYELKFKRNKPVATLVASSSSSFLETSRDSLFNLLDLNNDKHLGGRPGNPSPKSLSYSLENYSPQDLQLLKLVERAQGEKSLARELVNIGLIGTERELTRIQVILNGGITKERELPALTEKLEEFNKLKVTLEKYLTDETLDLTTLQVTNNFKTALAIGRREARRSFSNGISGLLLGRSSQNDLSHSCIDTNGEQPRDTIPYDDPIHSIHSIHTHEHNDTTHDHNSPLQAHHALPVGFSGIRPSVPGLVAVQAGPSIPIKSFPSGTALRLNLNYRTEFGPGQNREFFPLIGVQASKPLKNGELLGEIAFPESHVELQKQSISIGAHYHILDEITVNLSWLFNNPANKAVSTYNRTLNESGLKELTIKADSINTAIKNASVNHDHQELERLHQAMYDLLFIGDSPKQPLSQKANNVRLNILRETLNNRQTFKVEEEDILQMNGLFLTKLRSLAIDLKTYHQEKQSQASNRLSGIEIGAIFPGTPLVYAAPVINVKNSIYESHLSPINRETQTNTLREYSVITDEATGTGVTISLNDIMEDPLNCRTHYTVIAPSDLSVKQTDKPHLIHLQSRNNQQPLRVPQLHQSIEVTADGSKRVTLTVIPEGNIPSGSQNNRWVSRSIGDQRNFFEAGTVDMGEPTKDGTVRVEEVAPGETELRSINLGPSSAIQLGVKVVRRGFWGGIKRFFGR